jgi:nucleoside-diphosphate-sugar epimerase
MKVFLTGFPGVLARACGGLLAEGGHDVITLVGADHLEAAERWMRSSGIPGRTLEGAVDRIDFGLSGSEYVTLAEEVEAVLHLDAQTPGRTAVPGRESAAAREVLELGMAADHLSHAVVLSYFDVVGDFDGLFAEGDLSPEQKPTGELAADRVRAERFCARFREKVPVTVVRAGCVIGPEEGTTPLVELFVSLENRGNARSTRGPERKLPCIHLETAARVLADQAARGGPPPLGRLHLLFPDGPSVDDLGDAIARRLHDHVPAGFSVEQAARRLLKDYGCSSEAFFRALSLSARVVSRASADEIEARGLPAPRWDDSLLDKIVARTAEVLTGFA